MPNKVLPSLRGSDCALRQTLNSVVVAPRIQDHFQIADDNRQQIVEVVRDPASQLADSLEALRLRQLLARPSEFGIAFLGDRESHVEPASEAARLDEHDDRCDADGKKTEQVTGVETHIEMSGAYKHAERCVERPHPENDSQPQIEYRETRPGSQDCQRTKAQKHDRSMHRDRSARVAIEIYPSRSISCGKSVSPVVATRLSRHRLPAAPIAA